MSNRASGVSVRVRGFPPNRRLAEWSMALVLKTSRQQCLVSSNPTPSAKKEKGVLFALLSLNIKGGYMKVFYRIKWYDPLQSKSFIQNCGHSSSFAISSAEKKVAAGMTNVIIELHANKKDHD